MVSLLLMCRRLRRLRDGVVALFAMASFMLPMHRRLAIVHYDGDGATGDSINDNYNSATNVNNDGNGAADDDINDDNCDGAMDGDYDNNKEDGAMDDYDDGDNNNVDVDGTMEDNDDNDGDHCNGRQCLWQ